MFTHNLMAVITAFMAFVYLCANLKKLKDKQILLRLFINILLVILITAIYWIPLIETYLYTDYAVYEDGMMANVEFVKSYALKFKDFFVTDKPDSNREIIVFEIGLYIILLLLLPFIKLKSFWKENKYKKEYILFLSLGVFCLFMSTKYFPWSLLGKYLKMIQFPWRMLVFSNFFLAIICAINAQILIRKFNFLDNIFFIIIFFVFFIVFVYYVPVISEIIDILDFDNGAIVLDKYQAMVGMGKGEYLPVKANDSREYIIGRENKIYVLEGEADVEEFSKNGQRMYAKISSEDSFLELPYIYYPGYMVTLDGEKIQTKETENGFIGVEISNSGELKVEYTGTTLMHISRVISIIGILILVIYIKFTKEIILEKGEYN